MAITLVRVWDRCQHEWGYQVRADYTYGERIYNELLVFKAEPSVKDMDAAVANQLARLESAIAAKTPTDPENSPDPEIPTEITDKSGNTITIEKLTKEYTAWSTAKVEEQTDLRKASPLLDAVLKIVWK